LFTTEEQWEEFNKFFYDVVATKTEEEYADLLAEFKEEFHWNDGNPHRIAIGSSCEEIKASVDQEIERQALSYVLRQWLVPYYQLFVYTWVDQFFNCGCKTTSRSKGAHKVLKNWIRPPSQALDQV